MKWLRPLLLLLIIDLPVMARERVSGFCENGAITVTTFTATSTTQVQGSFPGCTVTVYKTGTTTPATIYSDNLGTVLGNPFTATNTGSWYFYADNQTVDIRFSGGGILTPFVKGAVTLWDSQGAGFYDIQQFGGVPDGVTDNTTAFNNAISAMPIGATLVLGPDSSNNGVYLVTSVIVTKNINISCTSPSVVIQSKTPGTINGNQQPSGAAITFSNVTNATVSGCTFDGNYSTTSGVYAVQTSHSTGVHIERNVFQNLGGEGVSILDSQNIWVVGNSFYNIYLSGIRVEYPDFPLGTFWFRDNVLDHVGLINGAGVGTIATFGSGGTTGDPTLPSIFNVNIVNNKITNPGRVGIELDRCDYCIIDGNDVTANGTAGEAIAFSGSYNHITNNKCHNSASAGIGLYAVMTSDMSHNLFQGNILWNNGQGFYLAFGPTDDSATTSTISYETIIGNFAFNVAGAGGTTQNYGLQVYCDTSIPNPGNCVDFTSITYTNNLITGNNFAFNAVGAVAIDASGPNNVYTNNFDFSAPAGTLNMIQPCTPPAIDVDVCRTGFPIPTQPISNTNQYPILANGNTQTGMVMLAESNPVAMVGFNDTGMAPTGQLDLIASNQNAIIAFYTPKTTNISITAISTATQAVLSVASVPSEVVVGSYIYLYGMPSSCAYLSQQPQPVIATGSGTITIASSGSVCTYVSGGWFNTVQQSGFIDPRGWNPPIISFASQSSGGEPFITWCPDCVVNTTPPYTCAGSGTGSFAFHNKATGTWKCPF